MEYSNRELSWLEFNKRVLNEARDKKNPLLERLKFLSITSSNLDEFFMVRVASLKDMVHAKYDKTDCSGLTPKKQLALISDNAHSMVDLQYSTWNRSLLPQLKQYKIRILSFDQLTEPQKKFCQEYYSNNVYPVLTPMAVDSSRPFPLVFNKTLNICALLKKSGSKKYDFATVQVPSVLSRIVPLPAGADEHEFILLEELIRENISNLFSGYKVLCASPYRVMRNADLSIDEEEAEDLLLEIEKKLKDRRWGEVIRLEVEENANEDLVAILKKELNISNNDIYHINGPIDLTFLTKLYSKLDFDDLKYPPFYPKENHELEPNIFDAIKKKDLFFHHPYDSFDPVVELIRQASLDPDVLAIKQTLYRVSGNSPIIHHLAEAAANGKQVTVLVELKARFDEENNINWAKALEKAGCHVIYGLVGLKTHGKIILVVRQEEDRICRYVHLGTGNYNDITAKIYTDMGIMTCDAAIGSDASAVFNMLSGYSEPPSWNKLVLAPLWLRKKLISLIENEKNNALAGKEARIIAKMNSLVDPQVISALYEASKAGVKIDLIVRGICCLKAGLKDLSENIHVRSIIGRFLEHSRIFYFYNDRRENLYLSSADWMPRNLDRRIEIMFPIDDAEIRSKIMDILEVQLNDTMKANILQPDGTYQKVDRRGKIKLSSQDYFMSQCTEDSIDYVYDKRTFEPIMTQTEDNNSFSSDEINSPRLDNDN